MHCNQEQIEALLDGELTGPEGDAVLAHLRDCPGCRSYYRQLLAMEQALRADTDPVPEDYVLTGHPELAQQARQWLSRQGLEPDEDGIYPLTVQQIQGLNAAVPELELPTDDALRLLLED